MSTSASQTVAGLVRPVPTRRRASVRRLAQALGLHLLAAVIAVVMIFPLVWMVSTSVKASAEMFIFPPRLLPSRWVLENYTRAWQGARFSRYAANTAAVTIAGTVLTLVICAMAAYAFAKLEFRGRNVLFWIVLGSQMIPGIVMLIPQFLLVKSLPLAGGNDWLGRGGHGWLNSFAVLIIPHAGAAFGVFLLRQFFLSVPDELLDAARVDGAGDFRIFGTIVLPLARPALTTLAIFTFQGYWNDFLWPLVVISDDRYRTLQVGLTVFRHRDTTDWGPMMASATIATLPMVVVFLLGQRYFIKGIAVTGIQG